MRNESLSKNRVKKHLNGRQKGFRGQFRIAIAKNDRQLTKSRASSSLLDKCQMHAVEIPSYAREKLHNNCT